MDLIERIHLAAEWLAHSGIQEPDGGVHRWYNALEDYYAPTTTELTGYTIGALSLVGGYEKAIEKGVNFLARAWNPVVRLMPYELDSPWSYRFDTAIIARSLKTAGYGSTSLYRRCVESLDCFTGDSVVIRFDGGVKMPAPRWSTLPGPHQLKTCLVWHDERPEWDHEAEAKRVGLSVGPFILCSNGNLRDHIDRLHPYCYYLEGLLPLFEKVRLRLDCGIDFVAHRQGVITRSDVLAQLLRIRIYCAERGIIPLDFTQAANEFEGLLSM